MPFITYGSLKATPRKGFGGINYNVTGEKKATNRLVRSFFVCPNNKTFEGNLLGIHIVPIVDLHGKP